MVALRDLGVVLLDRIYRSSALDWNAAEGAAHEALAGVVGDQLPRASTYLGGDGLRPYLSIFLDDSAHVIARMTPALTPPRVLRTLEVEGYRGEEVPAQDRVVGAYRYWHVPARMLPVRSTLPTVSLTTLTNASRYRARRYPLNIARLAQWLRFQHVARAHPTDLALDCAGDVSELLARIASDKPEILGISLNFGELTTLRQLADGLRDRRLAPRIVVGNVLAAWAHEAVREACSGFRLSISESYGESDLESICDELGTYVQQEAQRGDSSHDVHSSPPPKVLVAPDERLLHATLRLGGQASLETSFGCQYSHCTFCPRDHRGREWSRPAIPDTTAVLERVASLVAGAAGPDHAGVLSLVDEDAFGAEGRVPDSTPSVVPILEATQHLSVRFELYTRLEQLLDLRWEPAASKARLAQLVRLRPLLKRVFVGVESGSDSQLRRYGKGQTVADIVAGLRAASLLGLPLEFGFITFDPLLTANELVESLQCLGRTDILLPATNGTAPEDIYRLVLAQHVELSGDPLFSHVAYMATELELFVNSPFVQILRNQAPELLRPFESSFARYGYAYRDVAIGHIASWCRVWTEGAFESIYRMRLAERSGGVSPNELRPTIARYRRASYGWLVALAMASLPDHRGRLTPLWIAHCADLPLSTEAPPSVDALDQLWRWVGANSTEAHLALANFELSKLEMHRDA